MGKVEVLICDWHFMMPYIAGWQQGVMGKTGNQLECKDRLQPGILILGHLVVGCRLVNVASATSRQLHNVH